MIKKGIEAIYGLSPMQHGMLFDGLYADADESGIYTEQTSCLIRGRLDIPAFERAWQTVQDHYPILRTAFVWKGLEQPFQVVHQRASLILDRKDWRDMPEEEKEDRLKEYLAHDLRRGFEFSVAPLMRLAVIQTHDDAHRFIWSNHHLLLDGWSRSLVLKQVFTLYSAFSRGEQARLQPARPYRDYISWVKKQDMSEAEAFWRRMLGGFKSPTSLVIDERPGPSLPRDEYGEQREQISRQATDGLLHLGRQHQLTLNTLVQGAWALLLSRYTGEKDLIFGTTVSGRPATLPQVESIVGLFINTLPMRIDIDPAEPLVAWLKRVQSRQVEMRQYEYSPLAQVQGWSDVPRGIPLFNTLLVFENYPVDESLQELPGGLHIEDVRLQERTTYPLTIVAGPGPALWMRALYNKRYFSSDTITRLLAHLKNLLESIADDIHQRLSDVAMLSREEHRRIVEEWNDTARDYLRDSTISEMFEGQAALRADEIAVEFGQQTMTYAELNGRANQVARLLRKKGAGPEVKVGLCMERSLEMIVAVLGILKSGAGYVPLDGELPPRRLGYMIENSGVKVAVTKRKMSQEAEQMGLEVVDLERDVAEIEQESKEEVKQEAVADNVAYVIYTSGSTGTPKGVEVTHRAVLRLVSNNYYASLDAGQVFYQLAPISFDASTFEIWGSLCNGGRLVVADAEKLSVMEIGKALAAKGVTTLWLTAGLMHEMVEHNLEGLAGVKQLLTGGDVVGVGDVDKVRRRVRGIKVINGYGPTESTTFASSYEVGAEEKLERSVPIGRPIGNTRLYILDEEKNLVAVGVTGELYIGGEGLARGYVGRPEQTAERFVPDPFSPEPGERMYRTGDECRYRSDGSIEYVGRIDNQVKIRGYRIELGEIEEVIRQEESVRDAVVVVREDEAVGKQLVGYVVLKQEEEGWRERISRRVEEQLPHYMVPRVYVKLEQMPLTPNGKVDRRALNERRSQEPRPLRSRVVARTPSEEILVGIWSQVLATGQFGPDDNFFDLGGHSLVAMRLISRVREAFGIELTLRDLFDSPTFAEFAARLDAATKEARRIQAPPIERISRDVELPLSYAQQRLWFIHHLEPHNLAYNIPRAIQIEGPLDRTLLERTLVEIVRRHESLRTSFPDKEGRPVQLINPESHLLLPVTDLSQLESTARMGEALRIAGAETKKPFDLARGPLLRAGLLRLGDQDHVLLLVLHHIISDGWSMDILIDEVMAIYDAFSKGQASPLEELPIQYADFAHWQRQWLKEEILQAQVDYWKHQLAGPLAELSLPADRPRQAARRYSGALESAILPADLSGALKDLSQRQGVTLFMTMLAAFQVLLRYYSGQEDIVVGTNVANRGRAETERLIGFFVNQLVLRTDLSGNPTFNELIARVREVTLAAHAHQDLPFEQLVKAVQTDRDIKRSLLFQVKVDFQTSTLPALEMPDIKLKPLDVEHVVAKYDLHLLISSADEGLSVILVYDSDLFEQPTVARIMNNYRLVLDRVARQPDVRIAWLSELLAEADIQEQASRQQQALEAGLRRFKRFVRKPQPGPAPMADPFA